MQKEILIKTAKTLALLFTLLLCMGVPEAHSQILQITEFDEDGKEIPIGRGISKTDINSYFSIEIDKNRLAESQTESGSLNQQLRRVELLQFRLNEGMEALGNLQQAYDESLNRNNREIFQDALSEQATVTLKVLKLLRDLNMQRGLQRFNEALEENLSVLEQYTVFFEIAQDEYTAIHREVEGIIARDGRYYVLGAWLIHQGESRPLSLSGFDTYSEQEFYRVDRFRDVFVNLSSSHENMLQQFREGDQQGSFERSTDQLISTAARNLETIGENVQGCVTNFRFETGRLIADEAQLIMNQRNELVSDFNELRGEIESVGENVRSVSNLMEGISAVHTISREVQPLEAEATQLISSVEVFADTLRARLDEINTEVLNDVINSCKDQLGPVTDMIGLIEGFRTSGEANIEALEFGEEVIRHSLANLPDQTSLSLKRSGFREAGDMVVVKLANGKSEEQPRDMAVRQMQMERVLPYLKLAPGILYARPTSEADKGVSGSFHIAPSYSVLLKFGSRKSSIINRLLQPGIGVNISALDMDGDNTPELGITVMGSLLKDYIQVGYGYNVNVQKQYFAFGLRLPLASMTLQGTLGN